MDPEVIPLGRGMFRVVVEGVARVAYAVAAGNDVWVFLDGRRYVLPAGGTTAPRGGATAHDETTLAAPMPATVVSVHATPGQEVARGDVLIRLEAMKMELPIAAPRDGIVRRIVCRPGQLVQPGVPLVELEP